MIPLLVSPDELQHFLRSRKLRTSKSLGQNFLICQEAIDAVLLGLSNGPKKIIELGPGLGTLTQGLITNGYQVCGIEKDDDFVHILPTIIPPKLRHNLIVVHGDLMEEDWSRKATNMTQQGAHHTANTSGDWSLVGNIPYNLSGAIIRRLTQLQTPPHVAIFLMQKEVAERIAFTENSMSLMGLAVGLWGKPQLLLQVPSSCFLPEPKVDSAVITLTPNPHALSVEKREAILKKAAPFFQAKRKKISTTLKRIYQKNSDHIQEIFNTLKISPDARPENLSPEKWGHLCDIL